VIALSVFEEFGVDAIYARNRELAGTLRRSLVEIGWHPVELNEANQSNIVSVPFGAAEPTSLLGALRERGIVAAARDGNLRFSVHFYNHEDDIERLTAALPEWRPAR
jgi:selenocysteine lyase/cysteine desulfurase